MPKRSPTQDHEASAADAPGRSWRLRLLRIAGGDVAYAAKLRVLCWEAYRRAGCPCGDSEAGMVRWWTRERPLKTEAPRKH